MFVGEVADGFTHREVINAKDHPEFTERSARLTLMDTQGVEAAILLPTLAVTVEYDLRHDVELTYASLRAFNRWLEQDWGYGADGRIFAVPMLSLLDLDRAMTELHRVIDAGARLVHLCPGQSQRPRPADPLGRARGRERRFENGLRLARHGIGTPAQWRVGRRQRGRLREAGQPPPCRVVGEDKREPVAVSALVDAVPGTVSGLPGVEPGAGHDLAVAQERSALQEHPGAEEARRHVLPAPFAGPRVQASQQARGGRSTACTGSSASHCAR
jgi:hypothetical protein